LWDSARKCLDVLQHLMDGDVLSNAGWRKKNYWRKGLKNRMLKVGRAVADTCAAQSASKSKNREKRISEVVTDYLDFAGKLLEKISESFVATLSHPMSIDLYYYQQMLVKHTCTLVLIWLIVVC